MDVNWHVSDESIKTILQKIEDGDKIYENTLPELICERKWVYNWVADEPSIWNQFKNGLSSFLNWTESRASGFIEYGGRMTDSFIGGVKGVNGYIYGVIQNLWIPSFGVSISNAKIPEIPENIGKTVEGVNLGYETANSFYEGKETATEVKEAYMVIDNNDIHHLANNPRERDSMLNLQNYNHGSSYSLTPKP